MPPPDKYVPPRWRESRKRAANRQVFSAGDCQVRCRTFLTHFAKHGPESHRLSINYELKTVSLGASAGRTIEAHTKEHFGGLCRSLHNQRGRSSTAVCSQVKRIARLPSPAHRMKCYL